VGCASGDAECFAQVVLTHLLKTEELVHSGEEPLPALALCQVDEPTSEEVAESEEEHDPDAEEVSETSELDAAEKSEEVAEEVVEDIVEAVTETDPVKVSLPSYQNCMGLL